MNYYCENYDEKLAIMAKIVASKFLNVVIIVTLEINFYETLKKFESIGTLKKKITRDENNKRL